MFANNNLLRNYLSFELSAPQLLSAILQHDAQKVYANMYCTDAKSIFVTVKNDKSRNSSSSSVPQVLQDIPRLHFYNKDPKLTEAVIYGLLTSEKYPQDFSKSFFATFCQAFMSYSQSRVTNIEELTYNNPASARSSDQQLYISKILVVPIFSKGNTINYKLITFIKHKACNAIVLIIVSSRYLIRQNQTCKYTVYFGNERFYLGNLDKINYNPYIHKLCVFANQAETPRHFNKIIPIDKTLEPIITECLKSPTLSTRFDKVYTENELINNPSLQNAIWQAIPRVGHATGTKILKTMYRAA